MGTGRVTRPFESAVIESRQIPFEISLIELAGSAYGFQIVETSGGTCPFTRLLQGREQHGGKYGNNGDHDQKFNQRER